MASILAEADDHGIWPEMVQMGDNIDKSREQDEMTHEIDPDLARELRAWLDGLEMDRVPGSSGQRGSTDTLQVRVPSDVLRRLFELCTQSITPDGKIRHTGIGWHVERALRLYLAVLEVPREDGGA